NAYFLKLTGTNPNVQLKITESVSVSDVSVQEGNSGTTNAVFTLTLSAPLTQGVTVQYATGDGTAKASTGDYVAGSGQVSFAPGVVSQVVTVAVNGDSVNEANENFSVNLFSPVGVVLGKGTGVATIVNDDPLPSLSVAAA